MDNPIALRRSRGHDGFTLIELMVVVLIIALLIAIAIPTFLGARQRAENRAVQSNLRNALTAAKTLLADKQTYLDVDQATTIADLNAINPNLTFQAVASTSDRQVLVVSSDTQITLGAQSTSGDCYWVRDGTTVTNGGTMYATLSNTACTTTVPADSSFGPRW